MNMKDRSTFNRNVGGHAYGNFLSMFNRAFDERMKYVNKAFGLRCFTDLINSGAFSSLDCLAESMYIYDLVYRGLMQRTKNKRDPENYVNHFYGQNKDVVLVTAGFGRNPSIATMFALRTKWFTYAIDHRLDEKWTDTLHEDYESHDITSRLVRMNGAPATPIDFGARPILFLFDHDFCRTKDAEHIVESFVTTGPSVFIADGTLNYGFLGNKFSNIFADVFSNISPENNPSTRLTYGCVFLADKIATELGYIDRNRS